MLFLFQLEELRFEVVSTCLLYTIFIFLLISLPIICLQTNPVYAVFSFIITALCAFLLLLLVGAEFFAIIILIIYIGVITVLFIFVVIMYNIRSVSFLVTSVVQAPLALLVFYKLLWFNNVCMKSVGVILRQHPQINVEVWTADVVHLVSLFNEHSTVFLVCGLLIFIAMLGSVVLTAPFYKQYV